MKKIALLSVAAAALLFSACEKKGNSYEFAQILYPSYSGKLLYADQTEDSIKFATTFDWTLSLGADWVSANPDSMYGVVPDGYYMINKVPLHFEVNTTDTGWRVKRAVRTALRMPTRSLALPMRSMRATSAA